MCHVLWRFIRCGAVTVLMLVLMLCLVHDVGSVPSVTPPTSLVQEGDSLTLTCTGESKHTYRDVHWKRQQEIIAPTYINIPTYKRFNWCDNSSVIDSNKRYSIACENNYRVFRLTIWNITMEDHNSTWGCEFTDSKDKTHKSNVANVFVLIPPQIPVISDTRKLANGTVIIWGKEARQLTLQCLSKEGYPEQTVNWFVDTISGSPLQSDSSVVTQSNGTFTVWSNYTFTPTQADDRTTYICQSTTNATTLTPSTTSVQLLLVVPPQKPTITNTTSGTVVWGQNDTAMTLECVSRDGFPQQTAHWYRHTLSGSPLEASETVAEENSLFTVWSSYTLTPTPSDNGTTYICQSSSENTLIENSSTEVDLYVAVPPQDPEILNTNTSKDGVDIVWGNLGNVTILRCVSRFGYPQQTVAWYDATGAGTPLTSDVSVSEMDGTFTVWSNYTFTPTQADNGSVYICQSSSGAGTNVHIVLQTEVELRLKEINVDVIRSGGGVSEDKDDEAIVTMTTDVGLIGGAAGGGVAGLILVVLLVVFIRRLFNTEDGGLPKITGYRTRYVRRGINRENVDAMVAKVTEELEEMAEPGTSQVPRNDAIYLHPFLDDNYAVIEDHPRTVEVTIEASSQQLAAAAAAQGPDEPEPPDIEYLHPIPRSDDGDITRSGDYDPGDPKYLPMDGAQHTDRARNDVPNPNNAEYLPMDAAQDRSRDTKDGNTPQVDTAATGDGPGVTTTDMEHQAYVNAAAADILSEERLQDKQSTGVYRNLATARSDYEDITSTDHEYKNTPSEVSAKPKHTKASGNGSKTVYMDMTNPSLDNDSQNTPSGGSKPSKSKAKLTRSTGHGDKTEYMDMRATSPGHEYRNSPLEDTAKLRLAKTKERKTEYIHMSSTRTLPDHEYGNTRSESQARPKHRSGRSTEHRPEFVDISIQRHSKDQAKAEYVDMTTHAGTVDIDVLDSVSMSQQSRQAEYVEMKRNSKYKEELEQSRKAEYVEMKRQSKDKDKLETGATRQRAAGEIRSQQSGQAEYVEMKRQSKDKDKLESVATIKTGASKDTSKQSGAESQQSGATLRQKSGISFSSNETIAEYQNLRQQSSNKNLEPDTEDTSL